MQLQLILHVAQHSERCCVVLHCIAAFARYAAQHCVAIMDHFVIYENKNCIVSYMAFGKLHYTRLDELGYTLPAMKMNNSKWWYRCGKRHRDEHDAHGRILPAHIDDDGNKCWYYHGKIHRDERDEHGYTLSAITMYNGSKFWYRYSKQHRVDRDKYGKILPAVIYSDGRTEHWINGEKIE